MVAEGGVGAGVGEEFVGAGCEIAGEQEGTDFVLREGLGEPPEREDGGANGGHGGERVTERELVDGARGGCVGAGVDLGREDAAEDAVDFAAALLDGGAEDGEASFGVGLKLLAEPLCAGLEFGSLAGGADGLELGAGWSGLEDFDVDAVIFEGGEEGLLCGGESVEAGEEDFRWEGEMGKAGGEMFWETAGAEPGVGGAGAVEGLCPVAEAFGVGFGPGVVAVGVGFVVAEQGVGLLGEGGEGLGGNDGMGVVALGGFPEGGFLERGEQDGGVEVMEGKVLPEVEEPGAPVGDGRRGPGGVAESALAVGVVELEAACGAGVAGEDGGAAGECLVDFFQAVHEGTKDKFKPVRRWRRGIGWMRAVAWVP